MRHHISLEDGEAGDRRRRHRAHAAPRRGASRGEYIEFLDDARRPLTWNHEAHRWVAETPEQVPVAA